MRGMNLHANDVLDVENVGPHALSMRPPFVAAGLGVFISSCTQRLRCDREAPSPAIPCGLSFSWTTARHR